MNYYSKETATKLMQKEIEIMKAALLHQKAIKEVIKQFEGKVFNKRMDTAIKGIDKRLSAEVNYSLFNIIYAAWDYKERSIQSPSKLGYKHTLYVNNNSVNLAVLSAFSEKDYPHALNADKRIRSDDIINNVNNLCVDIVAKIALLEDELKNIDNTLKEFKRIKSEQQTLINSTSYTTRQYFDIKF